MIPCSFMLISVYLRRIPHANSIVCYLGTTCFTSSIHPHVRLSTGLLPYKLRKCAGPTSSAWASTKNQPQLPTNLQLITPKGTTNSCRFFRSIPKKSKICPIINFTGSKYVWDHHSYLEKSVTSPIRATLSTIKASMDGRALAEKSQWNR